MKKSELKQMIKEVITEETSKSKRTLNEEKVIPVNFDNEFKKKINRLFELDDYPKTFEIPSMKKEFINLEKYFKKIGIMNNSGNWESNFKFKDGKTEKEFSKFISNEHGR